MKLLVPVFSAAIFISLLLSSPHIFSAEKNQPQEITAIALRNWPPQFLTDKKTGKPIGFAIDIMNRVAALSDLKIRYAMYNDWPDAHAAISTGQAVLAPNLGITAERLGLYDFTAAYETFRISIFVRSDAPSDDASSINAASDLAGKKVGVVTNNQGLVLLRQQGGSDLQIYESVEKCFMALLSGNIDALVYPEQLIMELALRSGLEKKIKTVGKPLQEVKRGIAIRKGNPELFNNFRAIIDDTDAGYFRIDRDGIYQQVNNAWLKMHGYASPAKVIGRHFTLTQVDVDLQTAQHNVTKLLSGVRIPAGESTRRCQDGSIGYHTFSALGAFVF